MFHLPIASRDNGAESGIGARFAEVIAQKWRRVVVLVGRVRSPGRRRGALVAAAAATLG